MEEKSWIEYFYKCCWLHPDDIKKNEQKLNEWLSTYKIQRYNFETKELYDICPKCGNCIKFDYDDEYCCECWEPLTIKQK